LALHSRISSGPLVFLSCASKAEILIDGAPRGATPLLLELEEGDARLELRTDTSVFRALLSVSSTVGGVTRLEPTLGPYPASLSVKTDPDGASVKLDGIAAGVSPLLLQDLAEGYHSLLIDAPGRAVIRKRLFLARDSVTECSESLVPGYALRMETALPAGSRVVFRGTPDGAEESYAPDALPLLPAGSTAIRVEIPDFQPLDLICDPSSASAVAVALEGTVVFDALSEGTKVQVDGIDRTGEIANGRLSLSRGHHMIAVRVPGFLPCWFGCAVLPAAEIRVAPIFARDPAFVAAECRALSWPFMIAGGVLAVGGAIVNLDSVAIGMSSDYGSYKTIKYASLGVLGTGIAAAGFGVGIFVIHL
jgi:hypothetical protein